MSWVGGENAQDKTGISPGQSSAGMDVDGSHGHEKDQGLGKRGFAQPYPTCISTQLRHFEVPRPLPSHCCWAFLGGTTVPVSVLPGLIQGIESE